MNKKFYINPWDKEWDKLLKGIRWDDLICANCYRDLPNKNFRRRYGCPWCIPEREAK